jgi:tetratricopeptide (TPR) repeat protein
MIEVDPNGIGGVWGRELLDRAGGSSWQDRIKSAEYKAAVSDFDRALLMCHQIVDDTAGTPDEAEAGCESFLLIGSVYQRRGWYEEAALAYSTAVDKYPRAASASEALVRSIDCYSACQRAGKRKFYKERIDEATDRLIHDFPKDPRASSSQLLKAKSLEGEQDWPGAIDIYKTVLPTSPDYTKALLMVGLCSYNQAQKLITDKNVDEAKTWYQKAEDAFKAASAAIAERTPKTLDANILKAYDDQDYLARLQLGRMLLIPAYGKVDSAGPVIDALDTKWGSDAKRGPDIQDLRGRLFLSQGKIDEAEKWVSGMAQRDPKGAAGPAGQLARALDTAGAEKRKANADSLEADDLWKRAAKYYYISISPQVKGLVAQSADDMKGVGDRFYAYGLHFNAVPDARVSFVDWTPGGKSDKGYWTQAAEIYEAALAQTPDYKMTINLGRTYGFLGKWVDAARIYQRLFDQEQLVINKPGQKPRIDNAVMKAKGELVFAYMEWGVAEQMAAGVDKDKDRYARCINIFTPILNSISFDKSPEIFWPTKYHQVRTLVDKGAYEEAKLVIDDTQRNFSPTFDDGKLGYKKLFDDTLEELKSKLPPK